MVTKRKAIKWIGFLIFAIVLIFSYIVIETDIPYQKSTVEPIKVDTQAYIICQEINGSKFTSDYSGHLLSTSGMWENGIFCFKIITLAVPPTYNISKITFNIKDPFSKNMTLELDSNPDLENYFDDFITVSTNPLSIVVQPNMTRLNDYKSENSPDIVLTSSIFPEGNFSTWAYVWTYFSSLDRFNVSCNQFLRQTSFDKWEAAYLFDSSERCYTTSQNITYINAIVKKLGFSVTIPTGYAVEDPEYRNLATDETGKVVVTEQLQIGETFHLTVSNDFRSGIKEFAGLVIAVIGVFGGLITLFYNKFKKLVEDINARKWFS